MKLKLLPHKVQKPAGIIFLISLVLMLVLVTLMMVDAYNDGNSTVSPFLSWINSNGQLLLRLFIIAFIISMAALLFSEEKVEDEMISHLRLRAVAKSAIIVIAFMIVEDVIWLLLPLDVMQSWQDIREDMHGDGIGFMIILYLLLFKRSIRKYNSGVDEE